MGIDRESPGIRHVWVAALLVISCTSTLLGFRALLTFDQTPGKVRAVPSSWPSVSAIESSGHGMHVLVFVHPLCACSHATLKELAEVPALRKRGGAVPSIDILFYRPRNSGWVEGSLWETARQVPGARIRWDEGGQEAKRFGAATSGFALLYGSKGELLFHGGLTASRGHQGTNYGIEQLAASLDSGKRADRATLVFGCAVGGNT
jgi:hypothetical protein